MKTYWYAILGAGAILSLAASAAEMLTTEKDRISYGIGMDIGRNLTNRMIEVNPDALAAGLKAMITGSQPLLNEEQYRQAMSALQAQMQAKQAERAKQMEARNKEAAAKAKQECDKFLAENKQKEGVVTTASGLQYKVISMGTGPKPTTNDTVIVHYRGTLMNDTEFDSSYKRGEPSEFAATKVVKGWTEALLLMPVGSKWQLCIPPDLGYGENGFRPKIGPNAVLQFDLELIGIKPKEPKTEKAK